MRAQNLPFLSGTFNLSPIVFHYLILDSNTLDTIAKSTGARVERRSIMRTEGGGNIFSFFDLYESSIYDVMNGSERI